MTASVPVRPVSPTHTPDPVAAGGQPHPGLDAYLASHAEGWMDGRAPWITPSVVETDLECAREVECPGCMWRCMNAVAQYRVHPVYGAQHRVFTWCQWPGCDGVVEL